MSSAPSDHGGHAEADGEDAPKKKGKGKLLLLALPVVLLGVGAGLWFSGILPGLLGMKAHEEEHAAEHPPAPPPPKPGYFAMPEMLVNLNAGPRRSSFLKIQIKLEVSDEGKIADVQAVQPRLQDLFTTYLREVRPEELRGSAGTHRLREELIARANIAVAPARITDVLFTEMLIQ
jgi:flagellar protein FliL